MVEQDRIEQREGGRRGGGEAAPEAGAALWCLQEAEVAVWRITGAVCWARRANPISGPHLPRGTKRRNKGTCRKGGAKKRIKERGNRRGGEKTRKEKGGEERRGIE